MAGRKKPLDHVVKLGLGIFVTAFALIIAGMFLTRPDRSIPPYTVGSQEGTVVAVHVPAWTSDAEIEKLIRRLRAVGRSTRDFGPMKIHPTTPDDPRGYYQRLTIYIFGDPKWTEPDLLARYASGEDPELRHRFHEAVRGAYRLDGVREEGRIGPVLDGEDSPATAVYSRLLFKGTIEETPDERRASGEGRPAPTPSPA